MREGRNVERWGIPEPSLLTLCLTCVHRHLTHDVSNLGKYTFSGLQTTGAIEGGKGHEIQQRE